jgi:hypothetical protein
MATLSTLRLDATIRKEFDGFRVFYETDTMRREPGSGSRCGADIACLSRGETVAGLHFYDFEPIPKNWVETHEDRDPIPMLSFHISRFNDIINILRYLKPLWILYEYRYLRGTLYGGNEAIGQQE